MDKTIFEKIVAREVPAEIIYEDEHTLAFLDIKPVNPGHTLVITKKPYRNLSVTPDAELVSLILTVKKITQAIKNALGAEGSNVIFNNEPAAGQIIFHTHAHVIPRYVGDERHRGWSHEEYDPGEMEQTAEKLRSFV